MQFILADLVINNSHQGIQVWGFVQTNTGIVAACMPALRPFFQHLAESISSRSRTRGPIHDINRQSGYLKQNDSEVVGGSHSLQSVRRGEHVIRLKEYPDSRCLEAGNTTKVISRNDKTWVDGGREGDSGSEDGILPFHGTRIVRTTEIAVT